MRLWVCSFSDKKFEQKSKVAITWAEEDKGAEGRKGLGRTPERRRRGIRIIKSCLQLILSSACRTIIICFFSDFVLRKHSLTWFDVDKEIRGRYGKNDLQKIAIFFCLECQTKLQKMTFRKISSLVHHCHISICLFCSSSLLCNTTLGRRTQ